MSRQGQRSPLTFTHTFPRTLMVKSDARVTSRGSPARVNCSTRLRASVKLSMPCGRHGNSTAAASTSLPGAAKDVGIKSVPHTTRHVPLCLARTGPAAGSKLQHLTPCLGYQQTAQKLGHAPCPAHCQQQPPAGRCGLGCGFRLLIGVSARIVGARWAGLGACSRPHRIRPRTTMSAALAAWAITTYI